MANREYFDQVKHMLLTEGFASDIEGVKAIASLNLSQHTDWLLEIFRDVASNNYFRRLMQVLSEALTTTKQRTPEQQEIYDFVKDENRVKQLRQEHA